MFSVCMGDREPRSPAAEAGGPTTLRSAAQATWPALRLAGHWKEAEAERPGSTGWPGLDLTVSAPQQPGLLVQAGPGRRIRVALGERPLFWTRVCRDYSGTTTLVARDAPRLLAPIPASVIRSTTAPWNSQAWWASWARWLARQLLSIPGSPLSRGAWRIAPCSPTACDVRPARFYERVIAQSALDHGTWDFRSSEQPPLALRSLGAPEDARVKAWRRAARESTLPPLVLYWVSGLDRYVVLDGHHRLLAALTEGIVPPALAIVPLQARLRPEVRSGRDQVLQAIERHLEANASADRPRRRPHRIETINQVLIEAFDDRPRTAHMTRAWPLPRGPAGWDAEVRAELEASGLHQDSLDHRG